MKNSDEVTEITHESDSDVKIEPVSDENGSITSEELVKIPEEASNNTSSSEQVDAPVLEENVTAGLYSCSSST